MNHLSTSSSESPVSRPVRDGRQPDLADRVDDLRVVNTLRLSLREWVWTGLLFFCIAWTTPWLWKHVERFDPPSDYRLPIDLSNDYWMFERWCEKAAGFPIFLIGDSVVWGQYAGRDHTLSHFLNELLGPNVCANAGVDGLHPVAMDGLFRDFGDDLEGKGIILQLNPLWMRSAKYDMRTDEEFRFHHPRLVPQFVSKPACHRADYRERLNNLIERSNKFSKWLTHLKVLYFDCKDLRAWTMDHPYSWPFKSLSVPIPENKPYSKPRKWIDRMKTRRSDYEWTDAGESFQLRKFEDAIETLRDRGCRVVVMLGPFNTHSLTPASLERYRVMQADIEKWLANRDIPFVAVPVLTSEYYADGTHPVRDGYVELAERLMASDEFREFLNSVGVEK